MAERLSMDDQGHMTGASWPTLTEAAARSGYTREALRLRVRRGKLRAVKGNDGVTRIDPAGLADLPPPELSGDNQGRPEDGDQPETADDQLITLDVLRSALDRALDDLGQARSALDKAQADLLVDRGRAERAEARLEAESARAAALEARLATTEAALVEGRLPWVVRVVRAIRRP
jgi:hypothetical protein